MLLDVMKIIMIPIVLVLPTYQNIIKIFYQTENGVGEIWDVFYSLGSQSLIKFLIELK